MKQTIERGQAMGWPPAVLIYTDGASRGNPGPSSAGFVVYRQLNQVSEGRGLVKKGGNSKTPHERGFTTTFLYEKAFLLGTQTNNFAEYSAVLEALKMSAKNKTQHLIIRSDSELLVRQLSGLYKIRSPSLKKLYQECKKWEKRHVKVKFQHISREKNKTADALANRILDSLNLTSSSKETKPN